MAAKATQRKLTAILSADVVGYSRLMGADEEATVATLTAYRKVFVSEIESHSGRVVDAKGDALLAEFAAVTDAVSCAVEIQRELAERNTELSDDRRMDFRIGINLGEVMVQGEEIYGDGVNVAARLESLAESGGICISRPVYDQVKAKLDLEYEYLGEQQVKNIAEPVRAYKVSLNSAEADAEASDDVAAAEKTASVAPRPPNLPVQPRIAVLPFKNMSDDPEQGYFADGISEDLITDLSKISRLSVISQNTAFTYKGRAVNVKQVAQELGVQYVLEGSVRKAGNRVRITAQLIDAALDKHLWSERYDRELADIFEVQDEITRNIVAALDVKLLEGEQAHVWRKTTKNPEAYDFFLKGRNCWYGTYTRDGLLRARRMWEQAIAIDPNFARAIASLAYSHLAEVRSGWSKNPEESLKRGHEFATKAIGLDDSLAYGYSVLGYYYLLANKHEQALSEAERAVALTPDGADVVLNLARIQVFAGKAALAVGNIQKAMDLAPTYSPSYLLNLGLAYFLLGRFEKALNALKKFLESTTDSPWPHICLAATYAALGRADEAAAEVREVYRVEPDFSLEGWAARQPFKNPEDLERIMELLRKAGLPE